MKKSNLFLLLFFIIILSSSVNAVCTVTLDKSDYFPLETALATMSCDSQLEKNTDYTLTWYNGTDIVETDIGVTPSNPGDNFFESYTIPAGAEWTNAYASLSGTDLEGIDYFNVSGASANSLLIEDIYFSDDLYIGRTGSLHFSVADENDNLVTNSFCVVEFLDEDLLPVSSLVGEPTISGHSGVSDEISTETFKEGKSYSVNIFCSCGSNSTGKECWDSSGNIITNSVGSASASFTVKTWLKVNTVTNKLSYVGKEEIFICANVTNVEYYDRIPMEIYHQLRCSNKADNDDDTDRALLTGDDGMPDNRGISFNTTQMQCKRFIIPEAPYIQGNSNECYASTSVWVLDNNREKVIGYDTTSPTINITVTDLNIYPDWELVDEGKYRSIIDLGSDKYSVYNGTGISNIDIQLSREYVESIRSDDQYLIPAINIQSFTEADKVKSILVLNASGDEVDYGLEILDDGHVEIELRNVVINSSGWYNLTVFFEDYEKRSIEAQENLVGENKLNGLDKSLYFSGEDIFQDNILKNSDIIFNITTLKAPDYGNNYLVTYDFFSTSGDGKLIDEINATITGLGSHSIELDSSTLSPSSSSEEYLVISTVSMLNENMLWEDFSSSDLGSLTIYKDSLPASLDGLLIPEGSNYSYLYDGYNVTLSFVNDIVLDSFEVDGQGFLFDSSDNISLKPSSDDLLVNVYSWDGYDHQFAILSDSSQSVGVDIFVDDEEQYVSYDNEYTKNSIPVVADELFTFVYLDEIPSNPVGSGGSLTLSTISSQQDEGIPSEGFTVESKGLLIGAGIIFLLTILFLFMRSIKKRKKWKKQNGLR